jgi:hypothetical protein
MSPSLRSPPAFTAMPEVAASVTLLAVEPDIWGMTSSVDVPEPPPSVTALETVSVEADVPIPRKAADVASETVRPATVCDIPLSAAVPPVRASVVVVASRLLPPDRASVPGPNFASFSTLAPPLGFAKDVA